MFYKLDLKYKRWFFVMLIGYLVLDIFYENDL